VIAVIAVIAVRIWSFREDWDLKNSLVYFRNWVSSLDIWVLYANALGEGGKCQSGLGNGVMVMRWICKSGEIRVAGVVDMGDTIMGVV